MVKKSLISLVIGAALVASGTSALAQQRILPQIPPPQQVTQLIAQQQVAQLVCLSQEAGRAALNRDAPVLNLAQALQIAGISGEVVSYQLCQLNGAYVYQINVLGPGGVVTRYVVDAVSGAILPA
ncbi:MAG: PepSY domain-containing protein [Bauldia sp.]|nr:PepSY domain-containing protein [Bauldia sp.]